MIDRLEQQLRRDEGVVRHAYTDSEGYLTIGVGRLIDERRGGGLSDDEITYLLRDDISRTVRQLLDALPWAANLDEVRFCALVNMAFNLGVGGLLGFRHTLAAIKANNYTLAAREMLDSKWATQVGARATRLADQMRSGEWR